MIIWAKKLSLLAVYFGVSLLAAQVAQSAEKNVKEEIEINFIKKPDVLNGQKIIDDAYFAGISVEEEAIRATVLAFFGRQTLIQDITRDYLTDLVATTQVSDSVITFSTKINGVGILMKCHLLMFNQERTRSELHRCHSVMTGRPVKFVYPNQSETTGYVEFDRAFEDI